METNQIRPIESVYLCAERQMEGVLVPNLALNTAAIQRPNCMSQYDNQWAVQLGCHHGGQGQVPAQILVGVDCSWIFPVSVTNSNGTPVQTKDARLKHSMLTGRYLLFGSAKPNDELYEVEFPKIDETSPVGVGTLGATALEAQLAQFHEAMIEDIVTI